jgi:hypothetical protein
MLGDVDNAAKLILCPMSKFIRFAVSVAGASRGRSRIAVT